MFLSWNRVLNAFEPNYGPNSIFELLPNGEVDTPGQASFAQLQRMKAGATLIDDVKRALEIAPVTRAGVKYARLECGRFVEMSPSLRDAHFASAR